MRKVQFHAYALVLIMALSVVVTKTARHAVKEGPPKTNFELIPMVLGPWVGTQGEFDETTIKLLPSASLLLRYYARNEYDNVCLAIVYGTDLGDFHQPEVCLEGQGFKAVTKRTITIHPKNGKPFDAIGMITQGAQQGPVAFMYWFSSQNVNSTSLGSYQMKIFRDRLSGRKIEPSAMVRLSTAITSGDDAALMQLKNFAEDFEPYLAKQFASQSDSKPLATH